MKKMKKGLVISLAISALSLATAGTLSLQKASASTTNDFWLADGASVRFGNAGNGLRYSFQIKADVYDDYNEYAKFGIIIAPEDILGTGKELTPANVFGQGGATPIYNWAVKDTNGDWSYTKEDGKTQIVNLETESFVDGTAVVDGQTIAVKEFYGSLVNLLDGTYDEVKNPNSVNNIAREFRAVGYVGESTDGVNYTYTFVGDEDNVRSMAYVAQRAIDYTGADALDGDAKKSLKETYIDKVSTVVSNYTVEYYLEQADGSFAVDTNATETVASTIGAAATAPEKTFDGYYFDENNAENLTSGTTYANDKLVLKRYYKRGVQFLDKTIKASDVTGGYGLGLWDQYVLDDDATTRIPVVQVTADNWQNNEQVGTALTFTNLVSDNDYTAYVWDVYSETAGTLVIWNGSWDKGSANKTLVAGWNKVTIQKSEVSQGFAVYVYEQNFKNGDVLPETVTLKFGALKGVQKLTALGTEFKASDLGTLWAHGAVDGYAETADGGYASVINLRVDNDDVGEVINLASLIPENDYVYYLADIWSDAAGQMAIYNGSWETASWKTLDEGWNQVKILKSEISSTVFAFYFSEKNTTKTDAANVKIGSIYGVKGVQFIDNTYTTALGFSGGLSATEQLVLSEDGTEYVMQIKVTTVGGNNDGNSVNYASLIPLENPGYVRYELTVWCEYDGSLFWLGDDWHSKSVVKGWNTLSLTWEEVQQYKSLYIQSHNFKDHNGTALTKDTDVTVILGDLVGINE